MKNRNKRVLILVLTLFFSASIFAENNVDVVTTISVGIIDMQLDINENYTSTLGTFDGDTRKISINPQTPGAEIGVTVLDRDLYYGFTMLLTGQSVARYDLHFFDKDQNSVSLTNSQEVTSRTSFSIYSGYTFTDSMSLYGGATFGTGSYGDEVNIDEFGPFIGGRYALQFGATSSLNFDLSYSFIDTEVTIRDVNYVGSEHTIKSNNGALSLSATWLKALDRGRSFFIKFNVVDLDLKGSTGIESTTGIVTDRLGTATINGSQLLTRLSLGMGF